MNENYNNEELEYYLPDYVTNKITETDLIEVLEKEIRNNPKFELQFNEIKSVMNFLDSAELTSPAENYFINLPVKINERIQNDNSGLSIWEKFTSKWKLIVPAAAAVIVTIFVFNFLPTDQTEIKLSGNDIKKEIPAENNVRSEEENNIKENIIKNDSETPVKSDDVKSAVSNTQTDLTIKSKFKINKPAEAENTGIFLSEVTEAADDEYETLSDLTLTLDNADLNQYAILDSDDEVLFPEDNEEDINLEEESQEFSPEELKEILDELNKSQI